MAGKLASRMRGLSEAQFREAYGTEERWRAVVEKLRWPAGFVCPRCGSCEGTRLSTRPKIQCRACRHQASLTAGTIFHATKLPLTTWFLANGSSLWLLPCYRLCRSTWEVDGMAELPRSLPEFEARFPDDAACARWPLGKRWPDGFRCPACGHDKGWELGRERLTLQCAACERQVSVTAGTALHGSPLGLRTWFLAAWLMATHANGISDRQLWKQLGLGSYKSAWLLVRKLRRAMVDPER